MQKGHSTQKILVMIEAFKEGIGRGNIIATIYNYEVPPLFIDIILFECLILKNLEECLSERFATRFNFTSTTLQYWLS